jgi:prepilin-type N-terminal cleavage/methylation domain-containing protein
MRRDGFSLIELLVVIIIFGIVAALGTVSFRGWRAKYDLEAQVKAMYADIMTARAMAMTKKDSHFVTLGSGGLRAYEDTNPAPNGDGTLQTNADRTLCLWSRGFGESVDAACPDAQSVSSRAVTYPASWSGGGATTTLEFSPSGLANTDRTICVFSTVNPASDCIVVSRTRISIGKIINQGGACGAANCQKE